MNKLLRISLSVLLFSARLSAQETMYVPEGATISFGNTIPSGVFGYLINNGNIAIQDNGQLYFLGKIWMNNPKAMLTDGSTLLNSARGGQVIFLQPNPVYGNLGQQILHSGYVDSALEGPSFSNITIDNNLGLIITSDVNAIKGVHFRRGHIFLNDYNFVLGDSTVIGNLTGYDPSRYFVTGAKAMGGVLKYRYIPAGMMATFPIGPTYKIYSPAQLVNRGPGDTYFARAFSNVYTNAISGPFVTDSTLQLTWLLGKANPAQGEALLTLQHDAGEEDPVFSANRLGSYLSLFNTVEKKWDKPFLPGTPQVPGSISSSFSIASAMMNSRRLVMNSIPLYLTKRVSRTKKSIVIPNVFSPNGDNINDKWVIRGLVEYDNSRVEVYNRYGNLLFTSIGYAQPWDGTYRGNPLPVATYYYIINLKPGEPPLSGSVTILR